MNLKIQGNLFFSSKSKKKKKKQRRNNRENASSDEEETVPPPEEEEQTEILPEPTPITDKKKKGKATTDEVGNSPLRKPL